VKYLVTVVVAAFTLTDVAVAAADVDVERSKVKFTMSSDKCPNLRPGTTIKASGRQRSVTTTTAANGITTVVNYTRAVGKARDQRGRKYRFDYRNSFAVTNTTAAPAQYSGTMFDLFSLTGRGPANLDNGFVAKYTTDLGEAATYEPLYSFGDPIDFAAGTARCDPL